MMLWQKYKKLSLLFSLLSLAYLVLVFTLPHDKLTLHRYHISSGQDAALMLTIVIPYLIIWIIAFVGYLRLRSYVETVCQSKDGAAFHTISLGMLGVAFWLPIMALMNTATSGYYHAHPSAAPEMVILNNYVNIIILFLAFWFIGLGAKRLLGVVKKQPLALPQSLSFTFTAFSALYLFMVLQDPARQFPTHRMSIASYYLPDWLTVVTIVIPHLFTWFLGLQAIFNINMYRKFVKGPIYKQALAQLTNGLSVVIIMIVTLRCFESISVPLTRLSLGLILLVVYVLLILIGLGYAQIAKGAKSLQRIEEI